MTNRILVFYDHGIEVYTLVKKGQDSGREFYEFARGVKIIPSEGKLHVSLRVTR